jgi:hypothetical protein
MKPRTGLVRLDSALLDALDVDLDGEEEIWNI